MRTRLHSGAMPARRTRAEACRMRRASAVAVAMAAGLAAVISPANSGAEPVVKHARLRVLTAGDPHLRYEGRWGHEHGTATTVNSGSRILFRFRGRRLTGLFDTSAITDPAQIYVTIDRGPATLYRVDSDEINFTPNALSAGAHRVEIAVKDVSERVNRWIPPMQSAVVLKGFRLGRHGRLLGSRASGHVRMAFFGDSITQGVRALNMTVGPDGSDGTKTYSYLTARAFDANAQQVGFGRQGIIVTGNGNVPTASGSFAWNYQGSRVDAHFRPKVVVINQGTNDGAVDSATFTPAYIAYLEQIRAAYPHAWVFAMRPFGGAHAADIQAAVDAVDDSRTVYVDTTGWLTSSDFTDGVHPSVVGHRAAADQLIPVISRVTGLHILEVSD